MKKLSIAITALLMMVSTSMAYDVEMAKRFDSFYGHFTQKACAQSKLFISAKETLKMIRDEKSYLLLDIRTEGEASVIALTDDKALYIPLQQLFEKENLAKLPTDRPILIVCHSGTRAVLAAVSLKMIGFTNTRVVQGGLVALATANNPKNAPLK